jgi:hypothetical protein
MKANLMNETIEMTKIEAKAARSISMYFTTPKEKILIP